MEQFIILRVTDRIPEKVVVGASEGGEMGEIFLSADSLETGFRLITENLQAAIEAAEAQKRKAKELEGKIPQGEEKPQKRQKPLSLEAQIEQRRQETEKTPRGKRLRRMMEKAREFSLKHGGDTLLGLEVQYLGDGGTEGGRYGAVIDSFYLGFRRGFKAAKREAKLKEEKLTGSKLQ